MQVFTTGLLVIVFLCLGFFLGLFGFFSYIISLVYNILFELELFLGSTFVIGRVRDVLSGWF